MRALLLVLCLVAVAGGAPAQEPFDLNAWHEGHPVAREDHDDDRRFRLGLYPRLGAAVGVPNGIAGFFQCSISFNRPRSYSLYLGGGYEYGPSVKGANVTIGWGGVREAPARVRQRGFSGAFLRYRQWDSETHGRHDGLSVGIESGIGAIGATFEFGAARSDSNHWIPVARLMVTVGHSWLWKL